MLDIHIICGKPWVRLPLCLVHSRNFNPRLPHSENIASVKLQCVLRQGSHGSSVTAGPLNNENLNIYWIKNNINLSKMVIGSFDKGNFRFLVAASVNVCLWIRVEACQQERINDLHYPSPRPQRQGALVGSSALSYVSDLMFVLPTRQCSLGVRVGKGTIGSSLKFVL